MTLWVVGEYNGTLPSGVIAWDFKGVFSTEQKAVAACAKANYFIGPAELDWKHPKKTIIWPGSYYPKLEKKQERRKAK